MLRLAADERLMSRSLHARFLIGVLRAIYALVPLRNSVSAPFGPQSARKGVDVRGLGAGLQAVCR